MINTITHFLHMGGYGLYVWSAYGIVLASLAFQWFLPWQRWRQYHKKNHESHS